MARIEAARVRLGELKSQWNWEGLGAAILITLGYLALTAPFGGSPNPLGWVAVAVGIILGLLSVSTGLAYQRRVAELEHGDL